MNFNCFKIWKERFFLILFLFIFMLLFSASNGDNIHIPAKELNEYRITQPTLYHQRTRREISTTRNAIGGHHFSVTLTVPVDGEELVLDLELNKDLVPADHTLQYQKNGKIVNHKSIKEEIDFCHYHGSVRGKSNSWAAVSTCHGVSGVIFDGTKIRHIEPAEGANQIQSKHFLYDRDDLYSPSFDLGVSEDLQNSTETMASHVLGNSRHKRDARLSLFQEPFNANEQTRYVELVLVADNDVYKKNDKNITRIHQYFIQAVNLLHSAYTPVNIHIVLVGVVVWNEINEIDIVKDNEGKTLERFGVYRNNKLRHRIPHDNAQLITKYSGGGLAYVGNMCSNRNSVTTVLYVTNILTFAGTMGHEMGHNLGMEHDDFYRKKKVKCECPDEQCIHSGLGKLRFSSCSLKSLADWLKSGMDSCLRNKPERWFSPSCGDGFVQSGEECDCGVVPPTGELSPCHACCNMTTCKLFDEATCGGGARNGFTVTPLSYRIPDGMKLGTAIRVQASTSTEAQRFIINLQCGPNNEKDDIAFHFSFRFSQGTVVRNDLRISADGAKKWGNEKLDKGIAISRGEPFEMMFFCEENAFKVFINNTYFTEFKHRIPYQRITHLNFEKQITVRSVSFKNDELTYPILDGMYPGRTIRVQASTSTEAKWSTINLQCGSSTIKKDDIAFQLSFRFDRSLVESKYLQISPYGDNKWDGIQKVKGIPISRGKPFELLLLCEKNAFKVFINGVYFTEFKHRIPYRRISHLNVQHITVKSLSIKDAAEVTPLTYPIPDGMYPGHIIRIQASTSAEAQRFAINLMSDPSTKKTNDSALHLSFRFSQGTVEHNHLQILAGGSSIWKNNEKDRTKLISRGKPFEVMLMCKENALKVLINDVYITEFKHRIPYKRITHLNLEEDISVRALSFEDTEVTPFTYSIPDGVSPGRAILVRAFTSTEAKRFNINLQCGPSNTKDDIAFHLSFRFDQKIVARNHLQISANGGLSWGSEEREGGIPVPRGEPFELLFLCEDKTFKVFINGLFFTEFKHRIPYRRISHLNFEEQITVRSVSFKNADEITTLTYPIPGGMYLGRTIRVQASTSSKASRFTINLQCGPSSKDDIALHLDFRFYQGIVARNHLRFLTNGDSTWGIEENTGGIPITRGQRFEVSLLCEEKALKVLINGKLFTEFKHRLPYDRITHLNFRDQITVQTISF